MPTPKHIRELAWLRKRTEYTQRFSIPKSIPAAPKAECSSCKPRKQLLREPLGGSARAGAGAGPAHEPRPGPAFPAHSEPLGPPGPRGASQHGTRSCVFGAASHGATVRAGAQRDGLREPPPASAAAGAWICCPASFTQRTNISRHQHFITVLQPARLQEHTWEPDVTEL